EAWEVAGKPKAPRVGVIGLVGQSVKETVKDPDVKFDDSNSRVLNKALGELHDKADLVVLLYQGTVPEAKACADFCARTRKANAKLAPVHVILCLSKSPDDTPPGIPEKAGDSLVITVGYKGRYVGVVGAFPTGQP